MKRISLLFVFVLIVINVYCQEVRRHQLYTPPFKQGDATWHSFKRAKDRIKALQIPDSLLSQIPTKQLLDICLDFPYVTDLYAFDDPQRGFKYLTSEFNGFDELFKRSDVYGFLLNEYSKIELAVPYLAKVTPIERGNYSFKCDLLVRLIKNFNERNELSKSEKERFSLQTDRNIKIINDNPELFYTMCKEAVSQLKKDVSSFRSQTWYEGEIVTFSDGRQYRLSSRRTPLYSEVIAGTLITPDFDSGTKTSIAYNVEQNYSVTVVDSATRKYNCHAFAWHMHEGHEDDEVWIGAKDATDEDIYWNDGSYISISPSQATHVSYSSEHSAIRLGNGLYCSKWGAWPLIEHDSLEVPSGFNGYGIPIGFYKRHEAVTLSGPSLVCDSSVYSINNLPTGYNVVWSKQSISATMYLTQNSPNINQCTVKRIPGVPCKINLTASIYKNGVLYFQFTKELYSLASSFGTFSQQSCTYYNVHHPAITSQPVKEHEANFVHQGCLVTVNSMYIRHGATITHTGVTPVDWYVNYDSNYLVFSLPLLSGGIPFNIVITGEQSCGDANILFFSATGNGNLSHNLLVIEPNENHFVLKIEHYQLSSESRLLTPYAEDQKWQLEVYSGQTGRKMVDYQVNGSCFSLDTSNWESGLYVIRVVIDGEVLTQKITIK